MKHLANQKSLMAERLSLTYISTEFITASVLLN